MFHDLEDAVSKVTGGRHASTIGRNSSSKALTQRKVAIMKKMLRNEQEATTMIKEKRDRLTHEMHLKNSAI